jgi:molecular chaperone HtpG
MLGIADSATQFLEPTALEMYLSETAPVDFDPQDFVFAPKIHRWAKKHRLPLPTVSLTIATPSMTREVFKPYRTTYTTSHQRPRQFEVKIEDVALYPDQPAENLRFWIWYGVSDLPGRIGDQRVAGLRLRKHNISLGGPDRVTELFREITADSGRFNAYYIGEIHVLCPNAVPNARRDGFENVGSWPRIRRELLPFIQERRTQAYKASSARNLPVQKIKASAEQTLAKAETSISLGMASQDERDKRLKEVRKEREKMERWVDSHRKSDDAKTVSPFVKRLQEAETRIQDEKNFVAQKTRSSLDRKQRKLLQDVVSIVCSTLEGQSCKRATQCAEAVRRAISRKYGKS